MAAAGHISLRGVEVHNLRGQNTSAGPYGGRVWRHAVNGGWFSYDLKVLPDQSMSLLCIFWGEDVGRTFDVLVNGTKIATTTLNRNRPGEFFDEFYGIPKPLTEGKNTVTVKFQAHPGSLAGGVFGCLMLKGEGVE